MDPKRMTRIYEQMKVRQFELGAFYGWSHRSVLLKHAADIVYERYHAAKVRTIGRWSKEFEKDRLHVDGGRELKGEELEDAWDFQLLSVYFLLIGYAIENLLKGIIMIRAPEQHFKPKPKGLRSLTHNLIELCVKDCGITINPGQEKLLGELQTQIKWKGRYPTPLSEAEMETYRPPEGPVDAVTEKLENRKTQEEVDELYTKIFNEFKTAQLNKK